MRLIHFNSKITQDFKEAISREWLETNGLGGWASSTISGAHSRRYHGLLVAAMNPPIDRKVLLSKLDETIEIAGDRFELSSNVYPGTISPQGYKFLQSFTKSLFPIFDYKAAGIQIRKTVMALHGENTTIVFYEILRAPSTFLLELRPFVAGRDIHNLTHSNDPICQEASFQDHLFHVNPYDGIPDLFIHIPGADYEALPDWHFDFVYLQEKWRGLDFREDLFSYGIFRISLKMGDKVAAIISTQNPLGRDPFALYDLEKSRRLNVLANLPKKDRLLHILALAADQFVVRRGEELRTIIAGYHWFTDWGRDTMISLPGLTLATGRFEDSKKILQAFADKMSNGMLPNRFRDADGKPEYKSVDASLWFFVAIYKYLHYTADFEFVCNKLLPVLEDIIQWIDRGTRFNIHTAKDGLLYAGEPGIQLTWMDAQVGTWIVTPRQGKMVEINALWYNALKILSNMYMRFNKKASALAYEKRAQQIKGSFNRVFWNQNNQSLYDYIDGEYRESSIRPNQIFALSLPFPLLSKKRASLVLQTVEENLFTPWGLRSLAPGHNNYHPHYEGDLLSRDSAYHQGTVWAWLIGPFIRALVRVKGEAGKEQAKMILKNMSAHFKDAGIGTISEIFDADSPHRPCGCIAQAWSVAEFLLCYIENI
ncbi:MAG: amylo-alpha-1,6-glucosidase [bacterium]